MILLVVCLLVLLFTGNWVFAALLVGIYFYRTQQWKQGSPEQPETQEDTETESPPLEPPPDGGVADSDVYNLVVLRLELERMLAANTVEAVYCDQLLGSIDGLLKEILADHAVIQDGEHLRESRNAAWELLVHRNLVPASPPPWKAEGPTPAEASQEEETMEGEPVPVLETLSHRLSQGKPAHEGVPSPAIASAQTQVVTTVSVPPLSAESTSILRKAPSLAPVSVDLPTPASQEEAIVPPALSNAVTTSVEQDTGATSPGADQDKAKKYGWSPSAPSALERAFQALSGWPSLIVPFLVQNSGWFIGGLCVVAGSVFLVSYTTGFAKTLTVALILFAYTLAILWAGYQLRRRSPELVTSSSVLLCLGILLAPLNVAASVRVLSGAAHAVEFILGALLVLVVTLSLYFGTVLVSAIMDRSLQGRHPPLFMGLAATQLAVPFIARFPHWPLLALLHLLVLGLLAYSLLLFTRDWLHSIFAEQRKIAYYAAGTLLYAALVSFIHLTWGYASPTALPTGYAGPFLMALCGLLFAFDAQLKQWTKRHAFLSRFSFAIYAISILALLLSVNSMTARTITLLLAVGLYGQVLCQYLTLPPLYLLLGCLGWLYGSIILEPLPRQWHMLAGLPGLAALAYGSRQLLRRRSSALVLICCRAWLGAAVVLTGWSLAGAPPGLPAMGTALLLMALLAYGLQFAPADLLGRKSETERPGDLLSGPSLYAVTLMGTVAVAYAPLWASMNRGAQCAFGLALIGALWAAAGLHLRSRTSPPEPKRAEILLNSAVLNLCLSLFLLAALALDGTAPNKLLLLLPPALGGICLWLSLRLREQGLFCACLGLWGIAGIMLKHTYFPEPGSGLVVMFFALGVWTLVWYLEREPMDLRMLRRQQAALAPRPAGPATLLWMRKIDENRTVEEITCRPLQAAMPALWGMGILQLGLRLAEARLGWGWALSALLAAGVSLLVCGRFGWGWSIPLAALLGLGAWLELGDLFFAFSSAGHSVSAAAYALCIWRLGLYGFNHSMAPRLAGILHLKGNRTRAEETLHHLTFVMMILCVPLSFALCDLYVPNPVPPLVLAVSALYFGLAAHRYRERIHSYGLLATCVLGGVVGTGWMWPLFSPQPVASLQGLFSCHGVGLCLVLLGLIMGCVAHALDHMNEAEKAFGMDFHQSLYRKPLRVVAVVLALSAAVQQAALAWNKPTEALALLPIVVVLLASGVLLLSNRALGTRWISLAGILSAVLGVMWSQAAVFHAGSSFSFQPGDPAFSDRWLTLSLVALGLGALASRTSPFFHRARLYAEPLRLVSWAAWCWAMLSALALFSAEPFQGNGFLILTFLTLALCSFPLLEPQSAAREIRGMGIPFLCCPILVNVLGLIGLSRWLYLFGMLWGFTLWVMGNFVMERYNRRWSQWEIGTGAWPWLGLLAVSLGLAGSMSDAYAQIGPVFHAVAMIACAVYFLLMLRHSGWAGFPWLAALLLNMVGLVFNSVWLGPLFFQPWLLPEPLSPASLLAALLANLAWSNLLLWAVPLWRRHGESLSACWKWRSTNLTLPFLIWPSIHFSLWLVQLAVVQMISMVGSSSFHDGIPWSFLILVGGLLSLSFLHLWWLHRKQWESHAVLLSIFCMTQAVWYGVAPHSAHFPLFLALWSSALLCLHSVWSWTRWGSEAIRPLCFTLSLWLAPSFLVAVSFVVMAVNVPLMERLGTLTLLIGGAVGLGWQRRQQIWLIMASAMLLGLLHAWPFLWVPLPGALLLLPWYSLQFALSALLLMGAHAWLFPQPTVQDKERGDEASEGFMPQTLSRLLSMAWPALALVALGEWLLHAVLLLSWIQLRSPLQWLRAGGDAAAALMAALVLLSLGIHQAWKSGRGLWIYGVTSFCGILGFYIRLLWVGPAPAGVWDTAALVGAAYLLFIVQQRTSCKPLLHVVLVLPLLSLMTVPFQLASPVAGVTLISSGVLYLLIHRVAEKPLPLYLALTAFNTAVYLWVPIWASHSHLFQVYVFPVVISVLILLQWHRKELKPSVLNSARLAAVSVLYAGSTLDVFLSGQLAIFALAVGLSLVGIIIGIALRTRAFLYGGTVFLVFNILGQLILLFPEQRLGKAIMLLVLGVVITGGMIWFNLQRERILQRIRIFRADLETWT